MNKVELSVQIWNNFQDLLSEITRSKILLKKIKREWMVGDVHWRCTTRTLMSVNWAIHTGGKLSSSSQTLHWKSAVPGMSPGWVVWPNHSPVGTNPSVPFLLLLNFLKFCRYQELWQLILCHSLLVSISSSYFSERMAQRTKGSYTKHLQV